MFHASPGSFKPALPQGRVLLPAPGHHNSYSRATLGRIVKNFAARVFAPVRYMLQGVCSFGGAFMKSLLFSTACVLSLAASSPLALAQETSNFSGFYFGAEGAYFLSGPGVQNLSPLTGSDFQTEGFAPGIFAGYDFQNGNAVLGFLADVDFIDTSASADYLVGKSENSQYDYGVDWVASARVRMGLTASDQILIYGTGGAAAGSFSGSVNGTTGLFPVSFSDDFDEVLPGAVVGFGFEYALAKNWLIKSEYLHYRFADFELEGAGETRTFRPELDIIKVGIAVRF
jgi:outer membrane immunogenic protein